MCIWQATTLMCKAEVKSESESEGEVSHAQNVVGEVQKNHKISCSCSCLQEIQLVLKHILFYCSNIMPIRIKRVDTIETISYQSGLCCSCGPGHVT